MSGVEGVMSGVDGELSEYEFVLAAYRLIGNLRFTARASRSRP
jgi:hypothetical protein